MALRTPSVLVSTSNEFDYLARSMHHIELSQQQQQQPSAFSMIEVQYSPGEDEPQDTDESAPQPKPDDVLL